MAVIILGDQQKPRRVLVDPVHNAGAQLAADARQIPQVMQSALTSVPSQLPAAGCTTMPLGFMITARSSS